MTEVQRYGGSQQKERKKKGHPRDDTQPSNQVARVEVPPPAPSPPPAPAPVNVFDFLVPDQSSRDRSPSSMSGSVDSPAEVGQSSFADSGYATIERRPPEARAPKNPVPDDAFSYGDGPVDRKMQKYDSELDWFMREQNSTNSLPPHRTPAAKKMSQEDPSSQGRSTDKKRKRQQEEDVEMSAIHASSDAASEHQRVLHSGLTGGLGKMLGKSDSRLVEPSPLGPMKRSKVSKKDEGSHKQEEERRHHHRPQGNEKHHHHHRRHQRHLETSADHTKAIEGPKTLQNVDINHRPRPLQVKKATQSHSEFFLSLVDKDRRSHKGQSIWGTLKTFHEGLAVVEDGSDTSDDSDDSKRDREQKRLLKGLRMKMNKNGEIILFSRADRERSLSPPDVERRPKQVEGPST